MYYNILFNNNKKLRRHYCLFENFDYLDFILKLLTSIENR